MAYGKITAKQVFDCVQAHKIDKSHEHMVQPKMVYISNPTELGAIDSKEELEKLTLTCKLHGSQNLLESIKRFLCPEYCM